MCDQIILKVSSGYEIIEKEQTVKINKAVDLLLSGKQSEYSAAVNNYDGTATLYYSVVKCPQCDCQIPIKRNIESSTILNRDAIVQWASGQVTMSQKDHQVLSLGEKRAYPPKLCCPCCTQGSPEAKEYYDIMVSKDGWKIKVSRKIYDIGELLQLCWTNIVNLDMSLAYCETLVFNLKNGHTYIQLENSEGRPLCVRDLTENPQLLQKGIIYKLILNNQSLRREIKRKFKEKAPFHFCSREISLEKLVLATRFVGFKESFYGAIPFMVGTYKMFPGFKNISKKMHAASRVPQLYKDLNLPTNKATRRIIFENPGLMFYHNELKKLYHIVNNIDYFNKILSFRHIYLILAKMNCYPVLCDFLADAFKYENNAVVMKLMARQFYVLSTYAFHYMAMNDMSKKMERNREKWLGKCAGEEWYDYEASLPSVIRVAHIPDIGNCKIEGYRFKWLANTSDYKDAGRKLNNCLANVYRPVIAIKKNNQYVAAMALDREKCTKITETAMYRNQPVTDDYELCRVIRKWCEKFNIEWEEKK